MSTTSTTYSRHRKRRGGQGEDEVEGGVSDDSLRSREFYSEASREQHMENKWSSNKLKQELSSFIAEFSYLNDPTKSQNNPTSRNQSNVNPPQQNIQVYVAREEINEINAPFQKPELRRGVEWEDQQRVAPVFTCHDTTVCNKPSRGRVVRRTTFRQRPKCRASKSRPIRREQSRDLSCPPRTRSRRKVRRRFSGFRVVKSKSRAKSCRSVTPVTPMRRRVRSRARRRSRTPSCSRSRSHIREIPFQIQRHRSRTREIIVKRSKPKIVYKRIEPCSEPTIVTLFPKTIKRRPRRVRSRSTEPVLPCKCDMCTNKYKLLVRPYRTPYNNPCASRRRPAYAPCSPLYAHCSPAYAPCPAICAPTCAPCAPMCSPCPPKWQIVPRDRSPCSPNWHCNTGGMTCNRPWANQCYKEDCCQPLASRCVKSICFKIGSNGQCLNSNFTQYFHSILDRGACF